MPTDFVFPRNNEEEFIEIASKLGYTKLIFVYNYGENTGKIKEKITRLNTRKLEIDFGLLSSPKSQKSKIFEGLENSKNFQSNINKAKRLTKYVLVQSSKENRFVFEKHKDLIIFDLEDSGKKDFIHHRSSGLNHVLCSLAKENNITVAFSFNLILKDSKLRAKLIGRMEQNIKLCNKYKVKMLIASFATDPYEMRAYKDLSSLKFCF